MSEQWFVLFRGKEYGPLSSAVLKHNADAGKIRPDTMLKREAAGQWQPASLVNGLFTTASQKQVAEPDSYTSVKPSPPESEDGPQLWFVVSLIALGHLAATLMLFALGGLKVAIPIMLLIFSSEIAWYFRKQLRENLAVIAQDTYRRWAAYRQRLAAKAIKDIEHRRLQQRTVEAPPRLPSPPPRLQFNYKVLTQKDKWLSQKFDPATLERALNQYLQEGWYVVACSTATFPGFLTGNREEIVILMERRQ